MTLAQPPKDFTHGEILRWRRVGGLVLGEVRYAPGQRVQALRLALAALVFGSGRAGRLVDKTRKPGKAPVPNPIVAWLFARTLGNPEGEITHWISRAMAGVTVLAVSTAQKI